MPITIQRQADGGYRIDGDRGLQVWGVDLATAKRLATLAAVAGDDTTEIVLDDCDGAPPVPLDLETLKLEVAAAPPH